MQVTTKEELKQALVDKETKIVIVGDLAKSTIKKIKAKKIMVWGIAAAALVAIPFTRGRSIPAVGTAFAAKLTGNQIVALVFGTLLFGTTLYGLSKGYNVKVDYAACRIELYKN